MMLLRWIVAALLVGLSPAAWADLPPDPDALAILHEDDEGRRSPLLDPRGLPVYDDLGHGLQPDISIDRKNRMGYDLVFDFENTSSQPAGLGRIDIGVITLGPEVSWLNLNRRCAFSDTDRRGFSAQVRNYPASLYAPVGVFANDDFAVGVSLLYDILQDRHDVTVRLTKPGGSFLAGPGGAGFAVGFDLGNPRNGAGRLSDPAWLQPGESRRYRVAVRAVKLDHAPSVSGPQHWLAAIKPYHDHFNALYGGVTYSRDVRPVRAKAIASPSTLSPSNRMGFNGGDRFRPDLVGWGPLVAQLMRPAGFERTMLWSPGGLHYANRDLNFPSRFMSQLLTDSRLNSAFDDRAGLPRLAAMGHDVGLWWGRAARTSRQWDSPHSEPLDLAHADRVALALHELRLASETGATIIGLDAFVPQDMPVWQQYEWILDLRRRYPEITFVIEPLTSDVMHTLGPTFDPAWRSGDTTGRDEDRFMLRNPHYLADYLLPGHEIWGHFRYDGSRMPANITRVQRDAEYIASHGYVPVLATPHSLHDGRRAEATPTWMRTVPDSLKTNAHRESDPAALTIPSDDPADGADDEGTGNDPGGDNGQDAGRDGIPTRPLMLPNGRVIHVPIYGSK